MLDMWARDSRSLDVYRRRLHLIVVMNIEDEDVKKRHVLCTWSLAT